MKSVIEYLKDLLNDLKNMKNIKEIKQKKFAIETAIEILKNLQERNR